VTRGYIVHIALSGVTAELQYHSPPLVLPQVHMRAHGLKPIDPRPICGHPGCIKQVFPDHEGGYRFCSKHILDHGLRRLRQCEQPGCTKIAFKDTSGEQTWWVSRV
jgi:hypothetical protein